MKLAADPDRPGMFVGQLAVLQEGTYQVALPLPGGDDEPLSRFLQVRPCQTWSERTLNATKPCSPA